jgi:glycosyltransferase involved in cell wall biosynthesis
VVPRISVVVPTFERLDVLPEVLDALGQQVDAPSFEIVVVDDGSRDNTWNYLGQKVLAGDLPLVAYRQVNRGPAAARNAGVAAASGELVAFLGDDTVPDRGWMAAHLAAHSRLSGPRPVAVVGYTGWHQRMRLNPFLRYINEMGLQFGYGLIESPDDVPFNFLYTSNLSLPRVLLREAPFDEGFPFPAWEDTELAYRLTRNCELRLAYEQRARTAHDHPTDIRRFGQRQRRAGYCAVVFARKHPEMGDFVGVGAGGLPPRSPHWRVVLLTELAQALHHLPFETPRVWEHVLRLHYIDGLHEGLRAERGEAP